MDQRYVQAGKGLKSLLLGTVVVTGGFMVRWLGSRTSIWALTLLGSLGMVVGNVLLFVSLFHMQSAHPKYQLATYGMLLMLGLNIISGRLEVGSFIAKLLSVLSSVLSVGVICLLCMATSALLRECGEEKWSRLGSFVWKLRLLTEAAQQADRLMEVPLLGGVSMAFVWMYSVLFIVFCYQAYKTLMAQA